MLTADNIKKPPLMEIVKKHPEIYNDPALLVSTLHPLETFIIEEMLSRLRPISTNDAHNYVITKIWLEQLQSWPKGDLAVLVAQSRKGFTLARIPSPEQMKMMRADLKSRKIKYPSYEKVDGVMKTLESWGILTKRTETISKAKYFWILQPYFLHQFGKPLKNYLQTQNIILSW